MTRGESVSKVPPYLCGSKIVLSTSKFERGTDEHRNNILPEHRSVRGKHREYAHGVEWMCSKAGHPQIPTHKRHPTFPIERRAVPLTPVSKELTSMSEGGDTNADSGCKYQTWTSAAKSLGGHRYTVPIIIHTAILPLSKLSTVSA